MLNTDVTYTSAVFTQWEGYQGNQPPQQL